MTHSDATEQQYAERYLLGELTGEARDRFEDHLFDCSECRADVENGVLFVEAARSEMEAASITFPVGREVNDGKRPWFTWLWQPGLLAPVLAACMAVIVYQAAVVVPALRSELAKNDQPSLMVPLVLANAGARGDVVPEIVTPRNGSYALSVDIPPAEGVSKYRCTLYSPAGAAVWHVDVSVALAKDAVSIRVPDRKAVAGVQELRVEGVTGSQADGDKLVPLASYRYRLTFTP